MVLAQEIFVTVIMVVDDDNDPASGLSVSYVIYDENRISYETGTMDEIAGTAIYYKAWSPDEDGYWIFESYYSGAFKFYDIKLYQVGMGVEDQIYELLGTHDTDIKALLATVQADLDNPDQYKADVSALALEATLTDIKGVGWTNETLKAIKDAVDAIDVSGIWSYVTRTLTDPDSYKADVSALALEATLTDIKGVGWTDETLKAIKDAIDAIVGGTATIEKQNQIMDGTTDLSGGWISATDNLHDIYIKINAIPTTAMRGTDNALLAASYTAERGTDNAATVADGWDAALATILDNFSAERIGYLDELDFDLQAALTAIQGDLNNPDQYKADVAALALEATLDTHDTDIKALLANVALEASLGTHDTDIKALLANVALEATLGTHDTDIKALLANVALEATLGTHDTDIKALLEHADYGLSAIETLVDTLETVVGTKADTMDIAGTLASKNQALFFNVHKHWGMVVADKTALTADETAIQTDLLLIYNLYIIDEDDVDAGNFDLEACDVIYVSSSCTDMTKLNKLTTLPVPIITDSGEVALTILRMGDDSGGSGVSWGTSAAQTQINIVDITHEITLTNSLGNLSIYDAGQTIIWIRATDWVAGIVNLAEVAGDNTKDVLSVLPYNVADEDGTDSPAIRIFVGGFNNHDDLNSAGEAICFEVNMWTLHQGLRDIEVLGTGKINTVINMLGKNKFGTADDVYDYLVTGTTNSAPFATIASNKIGSVLERINAIMYKDTGPAFDSDTDSLQAISDAIALIPTTAMRGTDNAATVADGWDAALATILDNFSAGRIGYLDQLDFNLQETIAALENKIKTTPSVTSIFANGSGFDICPANKSIWDALGDGTEDIQTITAAITGLNDLAQSDILDDATPFSGGDIADILADTETIDWTDIAAIENKIKAAPSVDSIFLKAGGATCPAAKSIWDALGDGTEDIQTITAAITGLNDLAQADILDDATPFSGADIAEILTDTGAIAWADITAIKAETDQLPNWRFDSKKHATTVTVDAEAAAAEVDLTAGSAVVTIPTGATIKGVTLAAFLHAANKAANTHKIGLTLQIQKDAEGYGDVVVLTANPPVSLVDVDGAMATFAIACDVSATVTEAATYTFRWQCTSDNAGAVNYTSNFVLVITYSM